MRTCITYLILASWVASDSQAVTCTFQGRHIHGPCEDNVESPFIEMTDAPTGSPSAAPTDFPTLSPTITPTAAPTLPPTALPTVSPTKNPTSAPTVSPTDNPTSGPTVNPSSSPSGVPSFVPSGNPTNSPTNSVCETQDGVFGSITSEAFRTIEYGYEVEATSDLDTIMSDILPLVEKAVTDSILGEVFATCSSTRRKLRVSRQLEITGVTQNPEDVILDDVICGEVDEGNECVVVSGALSIYATTEESASALEETILNTIRTNMEAGKFDDVDSTVVRVTYTDLATNQASGSQSDAGNNNTVGDDNTPVLVGALVAAGVLMAAVLTVAYRRRNNKGEDSVSPEDGTATEFFGLKPTDESDLPQPSESDLGQQSTESS